jgi:aspartate 1-decarboxylase
MDHYRRMLRAKIHRATVTEANLEYEGSLTIPPDLMELADIREYEGISIWNVTRGSRLETYAMTGEPGSRDICINGAAAHLAGPGDKIIISAFASVPEAQLTAFKPKVVFVDESNRPVRIGKETPGPLRA